LIALLFAASLLAAPAGPPPPPLPQTPDLAVYVDAAAGHRAVLRVGAVLDDPALLEVVRSGLPLRLGFRVELWRDGFFDRLVGTEHWTAVLAFDPIDERFLLRDRAAGGQTVLRSYAAARAALERNYPLPLRPGGPGRFYYRASLEIETLSLSDLEEVEHWLRGELRPAVRGEGSVPSAVAQGAKRLLVRVLRLPTRHFQARSDRFRIH
jgi:hypothetical protein